MDNKINKEQVLAIIRRKGTVIPIDISKELNTSTILAGAFLSELIANKLVGVSTLKVGGSPVYYAKGQEYLLENYLYTLKGPEKKAVEMLKENAVLKDMDLGPVERVALRNAKDFAKQIEVKVGDEKLLFWKWFTLKNDEVQAKLDSMFAPKKEVKKEPEKTVEKVPEKPAEEKKPAEKTIEPEPKKEQQTVLKEAEKVVENPAEQKPKKKQSKKKDIDGKDMRTGQEGQQFSGEKTLTKGEWAKKVLEFFSKNNIEIVSQKIIKETEIEYEGNMHTPIGKVLYYFVARSKKKVSDADLAQVYVKKESVKLPIVFIHNGELTKKAKDMLSNEFKSITVFKIE